MDTLPRNWKYAIMKLHMSLVLALFLFQFQLHIIFAVSVEETQKVQIVYLGENRNDDPATTRKSHINMLSTVLGSKKAAQRSILYSYKHGFSGFAARLSDSEAQTITEFPEVLRVMPNHIYKLHTTRSWDFLGVDHLSQQSLLTRNSGKGTIIGVLDTGVWPESKSFRDEGMDPIPKSWKGICQKGELFNSTNCNKKIIGARWFFKGMMEQINQTSQHFPGKEYMSARDQNGHGTHTASTAAGNFVKNANYKGLSKGLARGGAPRAHLAIYKACWFTGGCTAADILQAFDKAVHDGVHILSLSIGGGIPMLNPTEDAIALGSYHATARGITVVCSAGNEGPNSYSISNTAPWIINVAASTIDRAFPTSITLGNNHTLWGKTYPVGSTEFAPILLLDSCTNFNATLVKGKIAFCFLTDDQSNSDSEDIDSTSILEKKKGPEKKQRAKGIIIATYHEDVDIEIGIPNAQVDYEVGTEILTYVGKSRSPVAKLGFPNTVIGAWFSPRVGSFSSRGPSALTPAVLKPDITAPGVNIIAAWPTPNGETEEYNLETGTSMSCPHVAGIAALLKSVYPHWSPAAIRSALVTSAYQIGNDGAYITAETKTPKPADPFDMGGGHVNPQQAANAGLVYDSRTEDFSQYVCSLGYDSAEAAKLTGTKVNCNEESTIGLNFNLPSFSIPNLKTAETITVTRTVTNVGDINSVYKAIVQAPPAIKVTVEPQILSFNSKIHQLSFKVSFFSTQKQHGYYKFGSLTWTDGKHVVRSPIAVRVIKAEYSNADL